MAEPLTAASNTAELEQYPDYAKEVDINEVLVKAYTNLGMDREASCAGVRVELGRNEDLKKEAGVYRCFWQHGSIRVRVCVRLCVCACASVVSAVRPARVWAHCASNTNYGAWQPPNMSGGSELGARSRIAQAATELLHAALCRWHRSSPHLRSGQRRPLAACSRFLSWLFCGYLAA